MSKLGYMIDGEDEDDDVPAIQVVVLRSHDPIILCGPVPVQDFAAHRARIAYLDVGQVPYPPCGVWIVVYGLASIPDGFVMLWNGTNYIVTDETGRRVAGPGLDPIDVANDAWTYFTAFSP